MDSTITRAAAELGRKGGQATSETKAAAARANAALPRRYVAYDVVTEWMSAPVVGRQAAQIAADAHNDGCERQGGYGSAEVYRLDADGYLLDADGRNVWPPHGQSCGAVRVP